MSSTTRTIKVVRRSPVYCEVTGDRTRSDLIVPKSTMKNFPDPEHMARYLLKEGFGRMDGDYFRRDCKPCQTCMPTQLPLKDFHLQRSLRRILNDNADLTVACVQSYDQEEHRELYYLHRTKRKLAHGFNVLSDAELQSMIQNPFGRWGVLEARLDGVLVAACLFDEAEDRLYGNQFYYDPDLSQKRSLGKFMVLKCIEHAISLSKDYLHMGAVTAVPSKFSYKASFRPLEVRRDDRWQAFEPQP